MSRVILWALRGVVCAILLLCALVDLCLVIKFRFHETPDYGRAAWYLLMFLFDCWMIYAFVDFIERREKERS